MPYMRPHPESRSRGGRRHDGRPGPAERPLWAAFAGHSARVPLLRRASTLLGRAGVKPGLGLPAYQEAGASARGPQFLDCVKRSARRQEDALAAVFSARMSYLEASPELAQTLQKAQTAWVQFRDANCAYLQSIARPSYADEAFQNCLLRTRIYRTVHLRWSVGDLDVPR
jgi:uncharacterized protein YecT (DUF1311 family)